MSDFYVPSANRGYSYNDPAFGITWPRQIKSLSPNDRCWPDFKDQSC